MFFFCFCTLNMDMYKKGNGKKDFQTSSWYGEGSTQDSTSMWYISTRSSDLETMDKLLHIL